MHWKRFLYVLIIFWFIPQHSAFAQDDESAIKQVFANQISAWNKGNIEQYMNGYQNSPQTTFVGKTVRHGWQQVLVRYKNDYPTKNSMGKVTISNFTIRMLGAEYAIAIGQYHLTRSPADGGNASGIFSLVWQKFPEGWKIILDHTS